MIVSVMQEAYVVLPGGVLSDPWLMEAALATAVIETPLFWLCGFRQPREFAWFFLVNLISNLLLNSFIGENFGVLPDSVSVLLGEIFVLALEFALCGYVIEGRERGKLLRVLLLTNTVSFLTGVLYFWWE